jgi:hypothetical protein
MLTSIKINETVNGNNIVVLYTISFEFSGGFIHQLKLAPGMGGRQVILLLLNFVQDMVDRRTLSKVED